MSLRGAVRIHPGCDDIFRKIIEERRLALRGLTVEDAERLVQVITGRRPARSFMKSLTSETSGNPFFIREVVQHLKDAGELDQVDGTKHILHASRAFVPESVKEVINQRLVRLTEPCNRALSLASVLGREFRLDVLAQVGSCNEDELLDALEAAHAAGLIVEEHGVQGKFSFSHALIREVLYEKLSETAPLSDCRSPGEYFSRQCAATCRFGLPLRSGCTAEWLQAGHRLCHARRGPSDRVPGPRRSGAVLWARIAGARPKSIGTRDR